MSRRYIGQFGGGGGGGGTLAGDANGPSGANVVTGIQTIPVNGTLPTIGQALIYDGSEWIPTTIPPPVTTLNTLNFKLNGDVEIFPLSQPLDCQPCVMQACVATSVRVGHRVDSSGSGASGTTSGAIYKRTAPGSRVQFASFSIAQGTGNNYSAAGSFVGTLADRTFAATDQIEFELTGRMVGGATAQEQDLFISILLAP